MSEVNYHPGCKICEILPAISPEMILAENKHWKAILRNPDQTLLGTTFITLKRHASELDELTSDENETLVQIRNQIIKAIRASSAPITFNIMCLKNDAFQADPDNTPPEAAHVHWHVKPRYNTQPIEFADDTFINPSPGRLLTTFERKNVEPQTAIAIADKIRENL